MTAHSERTPLLAAANSGKTSPTASSSSSGPSSPTTKAAGHGTINPTERATPDEEEEEINYAVLLPILCSAWLVSFFAALDGVIIITLISAISSSFGSFQVASWLGSAYFVATSVSQPLAGKLTDIFGRRAGLLFYTALFLVGTLICGIAPSIAVLLIGRVVAGLGCGGIGSIGMFIIGDLVPLRRRGIWSGYGNIIYGTGATLGAVFGGYITDRWGWRWTFLIQIPFLFFALLIVYKFVVDTSSYSTGAADQPVAALKASVLNETETANSTTPGTVSAADTSAGATPLLSLFRRVDYLGSATLVASLCLSQLGLNMGGNIVEWKDPIVSILIITGIAAFVSFVYIEKSVAKEPIIPVHLMQKPRVLYSLLVPAFSTVAYFALLYFLPLYFRTRGFSNTVAGLFMISASVGCSAGSVFAGVCLQVYGRCRSVITFLIALQTVMMSLIYLSFTFDTNVVVCLVLLFGNAFCFVGTLTSSTVSIVAAVAQVHQASIMSAGFGTRSVGCTIGIAVSSTVFQNVLRVVLEAKFSAFPDSERLIHLVRKVGLDSLASIPENWHQGVLDSYMTSLSAVWISGIVFGVGGILVSRGLPEVYLRSEDRSKNYKDDDQDE